jgi:hypothetical protein
MINLPSPFQRHTRPHLIVVGAVLLVLIQLIFEWGLLSPLQVERDRLVLTLQRRLRSPIADTPAEPVAQQRIQYYAKVLQELPQESERLVMWHALANKHAVRVKSVNYKNSTELRGVHKTLMQAELEASYPAVRLFIRDVLHHDIAIGLESMNISQAPGNTSGLKVQLNFVMYATEAVQAATVSTR